MVKVITYGTYDLLHYGHIRLLERAKALGDYLVVGITSDAYDKARGKINVQQSLMDRVDAVRATGIADLIIIEEYEGQKIDDIQKYDIDIFTVGSDWIGQFDYLREYCKVVYLERTQGISSSEIRAQKEPVSMGLVGDSTFLNKIMDESEFVNGMRVDGLLTNRIDIMCQKLRHVPFVADSYKKLIERVDAVYIRSLPQMHFEQIKSALDAGKHVLCESPITLSVDDSEVLFNVAAEKKLVIMEGIKTAYSTAYSRLLLLIKGGIIGQVVSVDAICTCLKKDNTTIVTDWDGFFEWAPTALLPVFQILGTNFKSYNIINQYTDKQKTNVSFSKIDFVFDRAVASIKVGDGVKSEGQLIVSGTEGYLYVPAPWWKTDYFEIRYENQNKNKRFFYQLEGEGIRYELVEFRRLIEKKQVAKRISEDVSRAISKIMQSYCDRKCTTIIQK